MLNAKVPCAFKPFKWLDLLHTQADSFWAGEVFASKTLMDETEKQSFKQQTDIWEPHTEL